MLVLPADAPRAHRGSKIVIIMGDLSRRGGAARIDGGGVREILYHGRSEEHTSELQSLMRISYAVFCLKKKKNKKINKLYTYNYKHTHNTQHEHYMITKGLE